jgi:membrane associated rhomboid family serine protease
VRPMDRLLARLDRSLGRYAIPNLMTYIVVGMGILWMLSTSRPEALDRLELDFYAVRRGELWRLLTFVLIPPRSSPFWLMVNLYFMWWVGSSLEQHWGAFKFNLYYFAGVFGALVAAYVTGAASNFWLNDASLLFAFATLFPDVEILLFFVLPVKVKWIGLVSALPMIYAFATDGWVTRASILASLAGYVLFFSGHWRDALRGREIQVRQKARRAELDASEPVFGHRECALCGAREADGVDIRVCTCEKCGGKPRALCLEHARNH